MPLHTIVQTEYIERGIVESGHYFVIKVWDSFISTFCALHKKEVDKRWDKDRIHRIVQCNINYWGSIMTNNIDLQKPLEAVKTLMTLQAATVSKSVELQKQSGEELASFFKAEVEKAKELKTPEDVVKFNVEANKNLFEILKAQGEAFTALATEASQNAMNEIQKMAK